VSAPVFVIDPAAIAGAHAGSVLMLDGAEGRHAVTVTRLRAGEPVHLVDGRGTRAIGVVHGHDGRSILEVDVVDVEVEAVPTPRIVVVQALAKGERGELAVEQLTEIGVDVIVPWSAAHCVVKWRGDRELKGYHRWVVAAHAAAKQSRRAWFPQVADLCGKCPVRADCLTYAINTVGLVGVWAGTTTFDRIKLRRDNPRNRCGTNNGYQRHRSRKEQACEACLAAHRAFRAGQRGGYVFGARAN
jgi:hypothetical protein